MVTWLGFFFFFLLLLLYSFLTVEVTGSLALLQLSSLEPHQLSVAEAGGPRGSAVSSRAAAESCWVVLSMVRAKSTSKCAFGFSSFPPLSPCSLCLGCFHWLRNWLFISLSSFLLFSLSPHTHTHSYKYIYILPSSHKHLHTYIHTHSFSLPYTSSLLCPLLNTFSLYSYTSLHVPSHTHLSTLSPSLTHTPL